MMIYVTEELSTALAEANAWLAGIQDAELRDSVHVVPAAGVLEDLVKSLLSAQSRVPVGVVVQSSGARFEARPVYNRVYGAVDLLNQDIAPKIEASYDWDRWTGVRATQTVNVLRGLYGVTVSGILASVEEDLETLCTSGPLQLMAAADAIAGVMPPSQG